ncbi:unnamed protein product [Chilo suppressalis]|uniref:SOWAHA-C winged helix-turn-helix domain-containing protein n=1 Tax=Chilo suppressalis TaxID=168631 RepID=A0ABN8B2S5_CHISP|nr:unnamed protein product [Chilo suppressalis]
MNPPTELSFDEILKFMLAHNGKVTNHELVKHFKVFLTNPDMRDEARNTFKKHVNTLANIKNQNNEKLLILKKKYMNSANKENEDVVESKIPDVPSDSTLASPLPNVDTQPPYRPPPPVQLNQDFSILTNLIQDQQVNTPIPISSPINTTPAESNENLTSPIEDTPPKVHPRKKSLDKSAFEKQSLGSAGQRTSIPNETSSEMDDTLSIPLTTSRSESMLVDNEQKISVKERKQMFNRMASESDVLRTKRQGNFNTQGVDEEDRVSLDPKSETDPLDSKQKQWILCAARGEYHALAKMCKETPKLVKTKVCILISLLNYTCDTSLKTIRL